VIAALDLLGKHWGASLSDLFGGVASHRVPSYYSTSVGPPIEVARIAAEKVGEGYPRLQIKIGRDVDAAVETVRRVWEAVGRHVRLAVDANRGWTARDALLVDLLCADIPFVMELPCNTAAEIATIRSQLRHPVYLDESTEDVGAVLGAVASGVADGFGLKITRLGGPSAFATVRDICAARSLPHTCDDSWGGDVIAAACVHMGATVEPRLLDGVWLAAPVIAEHYDAANGVSIEGGHIRVPTGPGLGVVPDEGQFGPPLASFG
jgi:L-alanine-DL-glutamate epimerase-like enolase superfamily enzyme